jgi:hypothetical protein
MPRRQPIIMVTVRAKPLKRKRKKFRRGAPSVWHDFCIVAADQNAARAQVGVAGP